MSSPSTDCPPVTKIARFPPLLVKKLTPSARVPARGSVSAAGYDLYAAKNAVVPKRGKLLVDTDIAIAVPEGTCTISYPFGEAIEPSACSGSTARANVVYLDQMDESLREAG